MSYIQYSEIIIFANVDQLNGNTKTAIPILSQYVNEKTNNIAVIITDFTFISTLYLLKKIYYSTNI